MQLTIKLIINNDNQIRHNITTNLKNYSGKNTQMGAYHYYKRMVEWSYLLFSFIIV